MQCLWKRPWKTIKFTVHREMIYYRSSFLLQREVYLSQKRFIYGGELSERLVESLHDAQGSGSGSRTRLEQFNHYFVTGISLLASRFKRLSSPNVCSTHLARDRSSDRRNRIILPSLFVRDMRGRSTTARSVERRSLDFARPVPEGKILE